jgi:flagellar motor protein MotB
MAELHVQPKRNNFWWIWLLLIIIIIAAIIYYTNYKKNNPVNNNTALVDSSGQQNNLPADTSSLSLAGANLWSQADLNSEDTTFDEISDSHISVKTNAHFIIYSIADEGLFENNKSDFTNDGTKILTQVGESIAKRYDSADVRIFDNTDSSASEDLSAQRAKAVSDYLVNSSKLDKSHVSVYQTGEPITLPDKSNRDYIIVKK